MRYEQRTCVYRGVWAASDFARDQARWQRRGWRVHSQAAAHGGAVRTRKEGLFHGARYTATQVITVVYERDRP